MKIVIISSLFPPFDIGGAEQVAALLARTLRQLGHQIDVISTCRRSDLSVERYRIDCWEGIRVWRMAPWNVYWSFDKQEQRPHALRRAAWHFIDLCNWSVVPALAEVLNRISPDVVNTHNIDGMSPVVWRVARDYTSAVVHTLHDYHLICPRATMRKRDGAACDSVCGLCHSYSACNRLHQRHLDSFVAPSKSIADLHWQLGWQHPKMTVIRNGIDIDGSDSIDGLDLSSEGQPQPSRSEPLRVVFMSRLEPEKGCNTVLRAIAHFQYSNEVEFHVAGRGSCAADFEALSRKMPHLVWHGFVTGLAKRQLLSKGDVFLQLSESRENAPLGLLEAAKYGLYLIGTNVGGIPEIIKDGEGGMLIPPKDHNVLVEAVQRLAAQRQHLRRCRGERVRIGGCYGAQDMTGAYLKLFHSLLADKGRGERLAER